MQALEPPPLWWLLPEALEGSPQLCASLCSSAEFHKLECQDPQRDSLLLLPAGCSLRTTVGPPSQLLAKQMLFPTGADAAGERATIQTDRQAGRHLGVNHGECQVGKVQGILKTYEREDTQPGAVRGSVPKKEEGARCVGGG